MMRIYRMMMAVAGEYAGPFRRTLALAAAASVIQALAWAITLPLLSLTLADGPPRTGALCGWLAALAALIALEGALRWAESVFVYRYWHRVTGGMRLGLAERLRRMPLEQLARRKSGDLATVLGNNVAFAATAISSLATLAVQLAVVPALLLGVVFVLDWRPGVLLLFGAAWAAPCLLRARRTAGPISARLMPPTPTPARPLWSMSRARRCCDPPAAPGRTRPACAAFLPASTPPSTPAGIPSGALPPPSCGRS